MLSCILCFHCEETQRNALWLCWHSIRELKGEKPKDVRNVFSKSAKASHHFRCHLQFPEQQSAYQIAFRCTPALLPQIMSGQNIEGFYAHVIVTVIIQLVTFVTKRNRQERLRSDEGRDRGAKVPRALKRPGC